MHKAAIMVLMVMVLIYCGDSGSGKSENPQGTIGRELYFNLPEFFKGEIAFQSNVDGDYEIYVLDRKGVRKITDNEYDDEYPMWSADGKMLVFQANPRGKKNYDIYMIKADGTGLKAVLSTAQWEGEADFCSADGKKIVYVKSEEEIIYYDLQTGGNAPMEENSRARSIVPVCYKASGDIVFTRKRMIGWDVALFKNKTKEIKFLTDTGESCRARWSNKGDRLAFVSNRADGKGDVWMMNADGTNQTRVTFDDATYDYYPSWSPDDRYIVYSSSTHKTKGNWSLWIIEVQTGKKWKIYDSAGQDKFPAWR